MKKRILVLFLLSALLLNAFAVVCSAETSEYERDITYILDGYFDYRAKCFYTEDIAPSNELLGFLEDGIQTDLQTYSQNANAYQKGVDGSIAYCDIEYYINAILFSDNVIELEIYESILLFYTYGENKISPAYAGVPHKISFSVDSEGGVMMNTDEYSNSTIDIDLGNGYFTYNEALNDFISQRAAAVIKQQDMIIAAEINEIANGEERKAALYGAIIEYYHLQDQKPTRNPETSDHETNYGVFVVLGMMFIYLVKYKPNSCITK